MKFLTAAVASVAILSGDVLSARLSADQRCSACLYTYKAIDEAMLNQTAEHKDKKVGERKAAVRDILGSVCDGPAFEDIVFTDNNRYLQDGDQMIGVGVDKSPEHGANLAAQCKKLVSDNEKRLVGSLSDFRSQSRSKNSISTKLCSKWTESCKFDPPKSASKKSGKTKITKSNKCLVDALGRAVAGKFDDVQEKVDCAVVEMPKEVEEEDGAEAKAEGEASEDADVDSDSDSGNDDDDELAVDDE